jgi:hypothetical protein
MLKKLFFVTIILTAISYAEINTTTIDKYHSDLSHWLVETSDSIDGYFIEGNTTQQSKTYAELKTSFAVENQHSSEYAIRLRLRLNLPRIQKKLRVVFEDADSDDELYDGTKLDNDSHLEKKDYSLRLEYFNYIKNKLNLTIGAGIRIKQLHLRPYFDLKGRYSLHEDSKEKIMINNRFRYYTNGDIENKISLNTLYYFDESFFFNTNNYIQYKNSKKSQTIVNNYSYIKILDNKRQARAGVSFVSNLDDMELFLDHIQLYGIYRYVFYKNWLYYEISPSILFRKENNYNTSYRFMVNFGAIFRKD